MTAYLISCTNATCAVPEAYREVFEKSEDALQSKEGWEPGSLNLAQGFAMKFRTPLVHGEVTRLLVDLEQEGDERWSRFSKKLPEATRAKVADRHAKAFLTQVRQRIEGDLQRNDRVFHLIVHTDPTTEGRVTLETAPDAPLAEKTAGEWAQKLRVRDADARHFRNVALKPQEDVLAREFPAEKYVQVRLSVSQSFFLESRPWRWEVLKKVLLETLPQVEG